MYNKVIYRYHIYTYCMSNNIILSAIILTHNEEQNIRECLENIQNIVDEIIVIDGQSSDKTVEISREYTNKIFICEPKGYADPDRQFAIEQCSGEWILYIDADERFSPAALEFIRCRLFMRDDNVDAYAFPRRAYYDKDCKAYTKYANYPDYQKRLFRKRGATISHKVHTQVEVPGYVRELSDNYYMIHLTPNSYSINAFTRHHLRYAKLEADQRENIKSLLWYLTVMPASFCYFGIYREFYKKKGYKDGLIGLQISLFLGSYYAAVNYYTLKNLLTGRYKRPSTNAK